MNPFLRVSINVRRLKIIHKQQKFSWEFQVEPYMESISQAFICEWFELRNYFLLSVLH